MCVCGVRESVIECELQCTGTDSVIILIACQCVLQYQVVSGTDCEYQFFVPGSVPGSM